MIASDLPLQGSLRPLAVQIVAAIRLELKQANFKIGDKTITYASCDDSTAAKGSWDPQTCTNNANGYKTVKNLLGHDRHVQLRLRRDHRPDRQPRSGRRHRDGQPGQHVRRPHEAERRAGRAAASTSRPGKRNYARVAVPDNFQGAADATFLQRRASRASTS